MFPKIIKFKTEKEFKRFMKKNHPQLENPPMRCKWYEEESPAIPVNCYNCLRRVGYPQYLGGDKECKNFEVKG
jgi:hypothetical protein